MYVFEDLRDSGLIFDRFRVIQEDLQTLIVEVQRQLGEDSKLVDAIKARLGSELSEMNIDVRCVEQLELPSSGKLRIVENRVQPI